MSNVFILFFSSRDAVFHSRVMVRAGFVSLCIILVKCVFSPK